MFRDVIGQINGVDVVKFLGKNGTMVQCGEALLVYRRGDSDADCIKRLERFFE